MNRLANRVSIVTGAARGIGQAIALGFAAEGAHVVLVDIGDLGETASLVQRDALAVRCLSVQADVSSELDVSSLAERVSAEFGQIDILVNNAGILRRAPITEMAVSEWDLVINSNLRSVFLMCRAFVPAMLTHRSGRVINIASQLGQVGGPERSHYSASKGGVIAFTRALAREVAPAGVLVNAIAPGVIETAMIESNDRGFVREARQRIPLGRFGKPDEVAHAAVFLASDDASFVVGQVLGLSGGEVMI
jgi:3-oxoacyl-[acyl-carrier protein] reductase